MAKPGQSSFRRILLSRLLLLSVPVLLAGVYVTYRKARSVLLETARQNLKESAVRQGESIQASIAALKANLVTASEAAVVKSQSSAAAQRFIDQLTQELPKLPTQVQCVQLQDLRTQVITASTKNCGNQWLAPTATTLWPQQQGELLWDFSGVYGAAVVSEEPPTPVTGKANPAQSPSPLKLVFSVPVYDVAGQLQSDLSAEVFLRSPKPIERGSLSGNLVVINHQGKILMHPDASRIGRSIEQEANAPGLKILVKNAIAGRQNFQHLSSFEKDGVELLAGYTAIASPITQEVNQKWIILTVTPLESALVGLKDIQQVLFILTFGLIAASFLATLYVARDLARPLETLIDYALNESQRHSTDRIPHNLKILEFNQLASALNGMIERLRNWAEELENAWQEAQAANQLKNEFLANTSHELRTPLNGIIGCLRLVRDGFCDDREEELDFLQRADDAAIHLLGIINDVLDIAKIEAGKLTVEMEPIDLRKLLNEVINLQAVPIQQKGLEFHTTELEEVIPVHGDPAKLKQVLLNVVGNAVKFTDSGSITIKTRIEPVIEKLPSVPTLRGENQEEFLPVTSTDNRSRGSTPSPTLPNLVPTSLQVVVTVKDTGIGIEPTQQSKLFRPFVMVDGSTTRQFGGTGLGLAISRNLVEMMGGSITLSSDGDGQGTTVEITLPMIELSLLLSGESPKSSGTNQMSPDEFEIYSDQLPVISDQKSMKDTG